MWKKLFGEHGAKNAVTLFHKANSPGSTRILTLLKQANAGSAQTSAGSSGGEQQGADSAFTLDVTEAPPTSDQLKSILEYVGENNAGSVVQGASDAADAQRRLRASAEAFQRPVVVDWNAGKVIVGDNESELQKLVKAHYGSS